MSSAGESAYCYAIRNELTDCSVARDGFASGKVVVILASLCRITSLVKSVLRLPGKRPNEAELQLHSIVQYYRI